MRGRSDQGAASKEAPRGVVAGLWLAVLATVVISLGAAGVPWGQSLAYVAAWLIGCTFPGLMVWRAVVGHSTVVRELGFGSVLGVALQLLVWGVGTTLGRPLLMVALPIAVVLVFAAVPRLRRHWWPRRTAASRTPVGWHVAMAAVIALSVYRFYALSMVRRALPPNPIVVSRDLWYNSAVSSELGRTIRPQDPFVAGEPLKYHWFADAHVTATAQLSGTPILNAMLNPWPVCILVVLLLAVAAAAEHFLDGPRLTRRDGAPLSDLRRWWVGPVAALFTFAASPIWVFGRPGILRVGNGFIPTSPSGILAIVVVLGLAGPVLDLLRGRAHTGTYLALTFLLVFSAGTKPSILPVVAFGAATVLGLDLLRRRGLNRPMVYVVVASAVIAAATAPILAGSTGGSRLQLFALMTIDPSYIELYGDQQVLPGSGGWLVPALAERVPDAVPIVAMLLIIWVLAETPRLLSLMGLLSPDLRRDPAVWWACALGAGGYAAMWVLAHPGYSQHFFWTVANPLMTVVTVTNAVRLLPAARRARTLLAPAMVVAVPALVAAYLTTRGAPVSVTAPASEVVAGRLKPYAVVLSALAIALVLALLLRRLVEASAVPLLTAVTIFCLAAALPAPFVQLKNAEPPQWQPLPTVGVRENPVSYQYVSPEQSAAALWLGQHSAPTSIVATNIFCWPMGEDPPSCPVNSMWLSGISGRRTLLSDWGFSVASLSDYDGTRPMDEHPSPWPERRELSVAAVQSPTREVLSRLREDYQVRWIFADDRASRISPKLADLGDLRYRSEHIEIYRLREAY